MGKKFMGLGGTDHFWDRAKAWILNQITSAVAAKIAEIVANAPEDLDTLKEIADWIKNHANDAAAMNTQITENKNNIAALSDDAAAMNTQITENKSNIATNTSDISALKTSVAGKADKAHTHTKSEITDFPTSLESFIKSKTVTVGDITIPTSCYFEIDVDLTSRDTVISAKLSAWSSNTGCFSVICYAKNRVFIVGDAGTTIVNVSVQVLYM